MSGYRVPDPNDPNDERNADDYGMNAEGGPEPCCLTCGHLWGSHQGEVGPMPCNDYETIVAGEEVIDTTCGCTVFVWPDGLRAE